MEKRHASKGDIHVIHPIRICGFMSVKRLKTRLSMMYVLEAAEVSYISGPNRWL